MVDLASARRNMVDTQLRTYDVTSKRVLDAVESVDRAHFMPAERKALAYVDQSVVVTASDGASRQLLQPMVFARMLQSVDLESGEKVLDVAGGSGYSAAVMRAIGAEVHALESSESMATLMQTSLAAASVATVSVHHGNLTAGHAAGAPYDVVFVNGALTSQPLVLLSQLKDGGRLVAVEGAGRAGRVVVFKKSGDVVGRRSVFDAAAPVLAEFAEKTAFSF
ncbi:MAG: protein-L-isoaspartate O-methyltransferase family protein [Beijerinckiaceae bacterium]